VNDDPNAGCSHGLHVGSETYAVGFGSRHLIVAVDPADVVCIPHDSSCQKMRCCGYTVVGEYRGRMNDAAVRHESAPYSLASALDGLDLCPECTVGFGILLEVPATPAPKRKPLVSVAKAPAVKKAKRYDERKEARAAGARDGRNDFSYRAASKSTRFKTPSARAAYVKAYSVAWRAV
jgi:hypothetical protein